MIKPWYLSRTILGALVSLVAAFLAAGFGVIMAPETQAELTSVLIALAGAIGSLVSIYGRLRAGLPPAGEAALPAVEVLSAVEALSEAAAAAVPAAVAPATGEAREAQPVTGGGS